MIINGINNQTVEIKIHNYESPDITDKNYDGNWLNIYLNVKSDAGNWQTINSSLLTWEVKELIEWFKCLANKQLPKWKDQEFIEPNISFYLLNEHNQDEKLLKIKFDLESRPKSAKDEIEYSVVFKADENELIRLANELEKELSKFPERI
jgi:hypothetical protein